VRYARRHFDEDEEVLVDVRPHWWYLSGPAVALAAVIAGGIVSLVDSAPRWVSWVVLVLLALAALRLAGRYTRWAGTRFVVTTRRVVEMRGLFSRRWREIPVSALTDVGYRQTIFERVIGAGSIELESAGRDSAELIADLPRPGRIHDEICRQMEACRRVAGGGPYQAHTSIPAQIDQLDQLRRRGLITDAEFEAKKAQLLDRL
jgi:membrane protein YdbS with pleckstrin-like domain